jgi:hypothetical protein
MNIYYVLTFAIAGPNIGPSKTTKNGEPAGEIHHWIGG